MAKVIINDNSGNPVADFAANSDESVGTQAQDAGAGIPFSCGVGACRTCVCRVTKGMEHVDQEGIGPKHIQTEDDEILSCIATVKADAPANVEISMEAENL